MSRRDNAPGAPEPRPPRYADDVGIPTRGRRCEACGKLLTQWVGVFGGQWLCDECLFPLLDLFSGR